MNDRVKQLRTTLGLTQDEFGKALGVTRSAISYIESGRSNLTDQMLFMICATFNVRKEWLKYGTGEVFVSHTMSEELATYMGKLMALNDQEKEKYALFALKLIIDEWALISKNIDTLKKIVGWISNQPVENESLK